MAQEVRAASTEPPKESPEAAVVQQKDDRFYHVWDKFTRNPPLPVRSRVVDLDEDADGKHNKASGRNSEGLASRKNTATSFEDAAETCRKKVRAIVAECRKLNKKYHDPLFDLNAEREGCLVSLSGMVENDRHFMQTKDGDRAVADVKRVADIFDEPHFFADEGPTVDGVRQGSSGNCWFLASVTALLGTPENIQRICVERDEKVGVYGFCFHRDGEWISSIIDDKLCIKFHEDQRHWLSSQDPKSQDPQKKTLIISSLPKDFKKGILTGPDALYFASCKFTNQTWLPLLEKAYAKAHLSYQSIEGGFTGEGIEDLTGGVSSSFRSEDVLDKDKLWLELLQVNNDFLFGLGSRQALYDDQEDYETGGVVTSHAYTVLSAREITYKPRKLGKLKGRSKGVSGSSTSTANEEGEKTVKLLKVRNPWGSGEWTGPWSDGAEEWTPDTMKELDHTFGDDGIFWISLDDFLKAWNEIDRTRLFGPGWTVAQQWTTVSVPRTINYSDTTYLKTTFKVHITCAGPVVFLLSKPDSRYFEALSGRYSFQLHFKLFKKDTDEYIVRSMSETASGRSVSAELDCEPGWYVVRLKLTPLRYDDDKTAEEIIKDFAIYGIDKILSVGQMFDLAHSRGRLREVEIAETKKKKSEDRKTLTSASRAMRELIRERRRRDKMSKLRTSRKEHKIAAKEEAREKRKAKKADKSEEDKAVEAPTEKIAQDQGDSSANLMESNKPKVADKGADSGHVVSINDQVAKLNFSDETGEDESKELVEEQPGQLLRINDTQEETTEAGIQSTGSGESPEKESSVSSSKVQEPAEGHTTAGDNQHELASDKLTAGDIDVVRDEQQTTSGLQNGDVENATAQKQDDDSDLGETASDLGSVKSDDFSWDSEIDGTVNSSDYDVLSEDGESDLYGKDEWFALATVGLRVYSKDPDASIEVEYIEETDATLSRVATELS